jgi:arylsulfatase A-like enzyme
MRILYLDLDTLRPDHLGCYGYERNTSPNIDRISRQGIRFENYYCSDAPCLPSRAALMTGLFGYHSGIVGHGGTAADLRLERVSRGFRSTLSSTSLPAMLKKHGFHTSFIGGFGERHSAYWFYAGFREIFDTGQGGMESAEAVTPAVIDWIERNAHKDNWYLHINYWDPHTPYRAPLDFGNPFAEDPLPEWLTQEVITAHHKMVGPHTAQDIAMFDNSTDSRYPRHPGEVKDQESLRQMIDGYDTGIRYMDSHIGTLFNAFEEKGVMDDLVVIISSDHGENMGELGIYGEHGTADLATCRVPLIIRWPGMISSDIDNGLHYNLDLLPTLNDLLGGDPLERLDGESFSSVLKSGADNGRPFLVLSQNAHVCQRSVRWGPWLYIKTWHDGYHLFPDSMLFNVENDPYEQHDLASSLPRIAQQGERFLSEWIHQMQQTMPDGYSTDPMQTVLDEGGPFHARGHLPSYIKRLTESGRGWAIDELRQKHPEEFQENLHDHINKKRTSHKTGQRL